MRVAAKWVQPEHYQIVGAALAAARRRASITQVELARRLGKPQSVVSAFEAGKRRVDLVEFVLIARVFGADPVEIFGEIANCRLIPEVRHGGTGHEVDRRSKQGNCALVVDPSRDLSRWYSNSLARRWEQQRHR
jgi:transcriptional regulator with XRE-family HTH domain